MPKSACRLWLRETSIRFEQLHQVSDQDAIDEGVLILSHQWKLAHFPAYATLFRDWQDRCTSGVDLAPLRGPSPAQQYLALFSEPHSQEMYAKNPWLWVIDYERTEA